MRNKGEIINDADIICYPRMKGIIIRIRVGVPLSREKEKKGETTLLMLPLSLLDEEFFLLRFFFLFLVALPPLESTRKNTTNKRN